MNDIFSFSRGKILLRDEDIYEKAFSESRSKTSEHNIYERSGLTPAAENKNSQNFTKTIENQS